jgi:hypothetical protein
MDHLLRVCPDVGIWRSPWCWSFAGGGGVSVFAGAESADRTKSKAALRGVGVSLVVVVVVVVGYPSLRALSLLTERSQKQLSVVLEFRWWWWWWWGIRLCGR